LADVTVTVLSWDKHNPRKDIKHPAWFALSNRVTEDPKLFALTGDEFKAWIYVLCQASQKNNATVEIFFEHASRAGGISVDAMKSALAKLSSAGVTETLRTRTQSVRKRTRTSRDTTLQTLQTDTTNSIAHAKAFASFWEGYPNKKGKTKAEALYKKILANGESPEALLTAREKYREQLKKEGTDAKFILHGPTFLARYKDFLDPDYGSAEDFAESAAVDFLAIATGAPK
jgi:hypothetical protein